jgi:hypothetical protein
MVIRRSDLEDPAKLKQFKQTLLQVHQLLADRQKKYGNTDAIINIRFLIPTKQKPLKEDSFPK